MVLGGLEDCERLFTLLTTKTMIAEENLVRHFLSIQPALEEGELENAYWLPGTGNPADGPTEVRSYMVPLPRRFKTGGFRPGQLRLPKDVAWKE